MPKFGKLEVDFVDMMRPSSDVKPLSDARFRQVMKHLNLEKFKAIEKPLMTIRKNTAKKCYDTLRTMTSRRTSTIPLEFQTAPTGEVPDVVVVLDDGTDK